MLKAEIDADIPGIADARLAGWRAGSPETKDDTAGDVDPASGGSNAESGEPGCGDVVEVCCTPLTASSACPQQRGLRGVPSTVVAFQGSSDIYPVAMLHAPCYGKLYSSLVTPNACEPASVLLLSAQIVLFQQQL